MVMCPMMYLHCYKVGPLVQEVTGNPMLEVLSEVMLTENCSQKSKPSLEYVAVQIWVNCTFSRTVRGLM